MTGATLQVNIDYKRPLSASIAASLSFEALLHHMYMRGQLPVHMDELLAAVEREKGRNRRGSRLPVKRLSTSCEVLVSLGKVFEELFQVAGNTIAEVLFLFGPSRLAYRQFNHIMKCNKLFGPISYKT
eukprot:238100_1